MFVSLKDPAAKSSVEIETPAMKKHLGGKEKGKKEGQSDYGFSEEWI